MSFLENLIKKNDITYIFIRHGLGCHNMVNKLGNIKLDESVKNIPDPELTGDGVFYSCKNSTAINNILVDKYNINTINIIGCSPLIRAMETAYYMSRQWKEPPKKIYVLPFLREINESAKDIYSQESIEVMNKKSYYKILDIEIQKDILRKKGILNFFDFSIVEKYLTFRNEAGNISKFINWFKDIITQNTTFKIVVFIITHAGVLNRFAKENNFTDSFYNNSGFIFSKNKISSINKYLNFKDDISPYYFDIKYFNQGKNEMCPSNRCNNLYDAIPDTIPDNDDIPPNVQDLLINLFNFVTEGNYSIKQIPGKVYSTLKKIANMQKNEVESIIYDLLKKANGRINNENIINDLVIMITKWQKEKQQKFACQIIKKNSKLWTDFEMILTIYVVYIGKICPIG